MPCLAERSRAEPRRPRLPAHGAAGDRGQPVQRLGRPLVVAALHPPQVRLPLHLHRHGSPPRGRTAAPTLRDRERERGVQDFASRP